MAEYVDKSQITLENIDKILAMTNSFEEGMGGPRGPISAVSPELLFINYISHGEVDKAVALFEDEKQFNHEKSAIDAPTGRYEGLAEIRYFAENWKKYVLAEFAWVTPLLQTVGGGRSCTELVVNFKIAGRDKILKVPMAVVGDIRPHNKLEEVRIYFYYAWFPGTIPYRPRQWKPLYDAAADHNQLIGAVKEYFETLQSPELPFDRWTKVFGKEMQHAGYRPMDDAGTPEHVKEEMAEGVSGFLRMFKKSLGVMPYHNVLRVMHSIEDGRTGVIEWISIGMPEEWRLENLAKLEEKFKDDPEAGSLGFRIPCEWDARSWQSGFAAYEKDEDGLIIALRICDYYGAEYSIDLKDTPIRN
jgi:hypothetical protein